MIHFRYRHDAGRLALWGIGLRCACLAALALVGVASAWAEAAEADQIEAGDRKLLADGLLSRGFYNLALPEYRALSERQPPPADLDAILFRLGECQRALGLLADAEANYRRLVAAFPQSMLRNKALLMRGLIILEMDRPAVAAELMEPLLTATNAEPDLLAAARYHVGEAREQSGDFAAAMTHFRTLRERHPEHELAAYAGLHLASLQARTGTPEAVAAAMALYQTLAEQPFNDRVGAEARFQWASLAYNRGEFEHSARVYRQLAERYPLDRRTAEAARASAWAHVRIGRYAEALQFAETALADSALAPEHRSEWRYIKANCERQLERRPAAVKSYDELLADDPGSTYAPAARYERLLTLFKDGAYEQVLKDAAASPDPPAELAPDLLWLQANAAEAVHDAARSVQFYRLLLKRAPDHALAADATYRLAYQLQQQQAWAEASRTYLDLSTRWPTNALTAQALFASGLCLAQAGQSDGALRDWHQLLVRFPNHETVPEALFQQAMEQTKRSEDRDAAATLDRLLHDYPAYPRLDEARFWRAQHAYASREMEMAERLLRACLAGQAPVAIQREAGFLLGLVLQSTGRNDEAAACFQPLLNAPVGEKFTVDRLNWLAEFQYGRQAFAESEAAARALLARAPTPEWKQAGATLLARALQALRRNEEAMAAYAQALTGEARTRYGAEAALRLGELLLATGRVEEAESRLKEAATRASTPELQNIRAYAYAALGQVAEKRGEREVAVRYHMSVAILFDDAALVPVSLDRAAVLLAELGREDESRATAAELIERYPDSAQAVRWRQGEGARVPEAKKEGE